MEELHKAINAEVSKLIKWETEAEMVSAALKDQLKEAEEVASVLDNSVQGYNQERGVLKEGLRRAKHSRLLRADLRIIKHFILVGRNLT